MFKKFVNSIIEKAEAVAYAASVVYGADYKSEFENEN